MAILNSYVSLPEGKFAAKIDDHPGHVAFDNSVQPKKQVAPNL